MAIKLTIDEIVVEADTAAEAVLFVREMRKGAASEDKSAANNVPAPLVLGPSSGYEVSRQEMNSALEFLYVIRDTRGGARQELIMAALHVDHPKGVGSRSAVINRTLKKFGYEKGAVYSNPKRPPFGRVWKAAYKMHDAIKALEGHLKSLE